ncbi:MAG: DUF5800 family protein [Halobacteria archaeon]|nr:DUF5800 family protein [Halobacteria archaeon]
MSKVRHSGTVFDFDEDGVDVEWEGHEFRMRSEVIEEAANKDYLDVTDHEIMRMIERNPSLDGPAKKVKDIL